MKLASNTKLESNLAKQLETYQTSSDAERGIKAIIFFGSQQVVRLLRILKKVRLEDNKGVVLIDASKDTKLSASKVK